jgi:hypothetical protein
LARVVDLHEVARAEVHGAHRVLAARVTALEADRGELALPVLVDQVEGGGRHVGHDRGDPDHGGELVVGGRVEHRVFVQGGQAGLPQGRSAAPFRSLTP